MQDETVNANVANLEDRLKLNPSARNALAILEVGPDIRNALRVVLPGMTPIQQNVLIAVVAFRLLGGALPAVPPLLQALPLLTKEKFENIAIAFDYLVSNEVLFVEFNQDKTESVFMWPALERLLLGALDGLHGPRLVDVTGSRFTD